MKKNSLHPNNGLSLSQAQSISNLCNQRAIEIQNILSSVNNFTKFVHVHDNQSNKRVELVKGRQLPANVVELLTQLSTLRACQAFLMENIKAKDEMLKHWKKVAFTQDEIEYPQRPAKYSPLGKMLTTVDESWGWEQLSVTETNEYLEVEAYASHIGQFIHKKGTLAMLREELPNIADIEWMEINSGTKSPVYIETHHTPEALLKLHEELAKLHREYEQRVNYFKAKVKNLVTIENARIAEINTNLQIEAEKINNKANEEYLTAYAAVNERITSMTNAFEKERMAKIKEIAGMRINVDPRFQDAINEFLKTLPNTTGEQE